MIYTEEALLKHVLCIIGRLCSPYQIFVYLLCSADVRFNSFFILTELAAKTQVFKEDEEKLSSLLSPNHKEVFRVLVLQHLEETIRSGTHSTSKDIRYTDKKRAGHLSELIVVRVNIMKAFNQISRGPHDATCVKWIKQLHGDLTAWHNLHTDRHHWLVYNIKTFH